MSYFDDRHTHIPAWQLERGMKVLYRDRWVLVVDYDVRRKTLSIINPFKGGLVESRAMRPDFVVTVKED